MKALLTAFLLIAIVPAEAQNYRTYQANVHVGVTRPPTCSEGDLYVKIGTLSGLYICGSSNNWSILGAGETIPAGSIIAITSGVCSAGWTEAADLSGKMLFGTVTANGDVGGSGGNNTITPSGANSASAVTPLGTIAWPVGVPTISGIAVSDHASHTHTYTQVPNHVHVQNVNSAATGALSGYTADTSTATPAASGYSTANPTGGVATGTTNGPGAALVHTISSQGAVAWPVGVPVLTGSSSPVGAQTFTGTPFDNRSAYVKVIFCRKT